MALGLAIALIALLPADRSFADDTITTPDAPVPGNVGTFSSLVLDGAGNPVVSYFDSLNGDLKVLHCDDPNCAPGGDSIATPDTSPVVGAVGQFTSIALDGSGFPVVAYQDNANFANALKILHCGNANCTSTNAINTLDTSPDGSIFAWYISLALDGSGNPVVSYYGRTFGGAGSLHILHCNDVNCVPGGDSLTIPDAPAAPGDVGSYSSLVLDGSGFPVVSYADVTPGATALKVMHCNDANCAGGGESFQSLDASATGQNGRATSIQLDSSGRPVVSFWSSSDGGMKILHCNDVNCAGGDDSITTPTGGAVFDTSLKLDSLGNPVVAITGKILSASTFFTATTSTAPTATIA